MRFPTATIVSFTFLCFGLSLFNGGVYWDDWTILGRNPSVLVNYFRDCGRPQLGYLHAFLTQLPFPVFMYRLITFLCHMVSALFFVGVSQKIFEIKKEGAVFLGLIFAVLPIYQAREGVVMVQYSICLLLLLVGLRFYLDKDLSDKKRFFYALIPFLISFTIEVSALVVLSIAAIEFYKNHFEKKSSRSQSLNISMGLLPVIYVGLMYLIFSPQGVCSGNNQLLLKQIFYLPKGILKATSSLLSGLVTTNMVFGRDSAVLYGLLFIGIFYGTWYLCYQVRPPRQDELKKLLRPFIIAFIIFVASSIPFIMVGKPVNNWDWNSRFQAFNLVSGPTVLFIGMLAVFRPWISRTVFVLFLTSCCLANIGSRLIYLRDNVKQRFLVEQFAEAEEAKSSQVFVIFDKTPSYNANNRSYRSYDYSALFSKAFGDERRVGVERVNVHELEGIGKTVRSPYRDILLIKDIAPEDKLEINYCIYINPGERDLKLTDVFMIYFFDRPYVSGDYLRSYFFPVEHSSCFGEEEPELLEDLNRKLNSEGAPGKGALPGF